MLIGLIVFLFTYFLISFRRLGLLTIDRPAGALVGAVAAVSLGLLSPTQAIAAVNGRTILLLFGMMGMGAFLAADGFFSRASLLLAARARTPGRLLGFIVWSAGLLAAFITNDAVCVLGTPVVVALITRCRLRPLPFLLALATAANTGSVATLVGNPQNMLCAALGDLSYRQHLIATGPIAIVGLALNHALIALLFRKQLRDPLPVETAPPLFTRSSAVALAVIAATAVAYTLGLDLAWTAVGGTTLLFLLRTQPASEVWKGIDWSILVFFAGLFVVIEAFIASGGPAWFFARVPVTGPTEAIGWLRTAGIFLFGSNVVSNVPFILLVRDQMTRFADPRLGWEVLALASTFAGNLTLLGSVANIIVAEKSHDVGGLPFFAYLKVGLPVAVLTTAIGTLWLTFVW